MSVLSVSVEEHIATVVFDRPPVNAVDTASFREIHDTFRSLGDDRDIRVAIFTSAGTRAFMAGADLKAFDQQIGKEVAPAALIDRGRSAREAMWAIYDCAVPVIAAVNGPAIGAGVAFAAVCDMIVAAEHASFAVTEINVGLLGASAHLSLLVGRHKARELYFTGEAIGAAELQRLGAVRSVVAPAELMNVARALAGELAAKSPIALRLAKEAMNRVEFLPLQDAYRTEQDYTTRLLGFEDSEEARRAYVEKRPPEWRWR